MSTFIDEYFGYINMWHAHNFYPEFLYKNGEKVNLEGNVMDWSFAYNKEMPEGTGVAKEKKTYVLDKFQEESIAFIEKNQHNPFFLYLALNMPHANNEAGHFLKDGMEVPMMVKDGERIPNYGQFVNQDWPNPEKGFATMLELIDNTVGSIEAKLEELGLSENTIVIFTSDNGPHQEGNHKLDFFDSNGQLRGAKRDLYEGGIRVPMIVKWPGKVQAGSVSHHQSAFWDILPTFCELAGVAIPAETDGISFLPTLLGQEQKQHDYLYWEFYEQGGKQAIRQEDWKYIKLNVRDQMKPIVTELYNLKEDPSESNNIIEQYPELAEKMERLMQQAHQEHRLISLFSM